jgi:hypothetical protein
LPGGNWDTVDVHVEKNDPRERWSDKNTHTVTHTQGSGRSVYGGGGEGKGEGEG